MNEQGTYDPKIFLPDEYLRRMTYKHPFMQQLIDDDYACAEDMQWFKYETMHRYMDLGGTDAETRAACARQFPYSGCDPFRHDNFLNIWNEEDRRFSICPVWADNLRAYCTTTTTAPAAARRAAQTQGASPVSNEPNVGLAVGLVCGGVLFLALLLAYVRGKARRPSLRA